MIYKEPYNVEEAGKPRCNENDVQSQNIPDVEVHDPKVGFRGIRRDAFSTLTMDKQGYNRCWCQLFLGNNLGASLLSEAITNPAQPLAGYAA